MQGIGQEEPHQLPPPAGRDALQGTLHGEIPQGTSQGYRPRLGFPAAEHLPDQGILPGKETPLLGDGRVDRELCRQDPRLPLGTAEGSSSILKKGEGKAPIQKRQGKIELSSGHIPLGELLQGGQVQTVVGLAGLGRNPSCLLGGVSVGDLQIGEQPHLIEKNAALQLLPLGVFLRNEIRQQQHGPALRVEQLPVEQDLQQLVGADAVIQHLIRSLVHPAAPPIPGDTGRFSH